MTIKDLKHPGLFAAGVLFGTAGIKALSSKDAKITAIFPVVFSLPRLFLPYPFPPPRPRALPFRPCSRLSSLASSRALFMPVLY